MRKIAIIPARSGSKGLPNKNILMLSDKHLIGYTIEAAVKSDYFDEVIVSTDSEYYGAIATSYGANVMYRNEELSNDNATTASVILDLLNKVSCDYFVLLQPTSPFRDENHIKEAMDLFEKNYSEYDFLVSMCESDKSSELIKPIFNNNLGEYDLDYSNYRRQNSKEYYPNGAIFIAKKESYKISKHFFGPKSFAYIMDKESSIDIDTILDFEIAISIMQKKEKFKILNNNIKKRITDKKELFSYKKDITLIGHSLFDFWNIDKILGYSINNLAISGISSKGYFELIVNTGLLTSISDKVFIFLGTNDIVLKDWKNTDTIDFVNKIISYIKIINPKCKIYFLEVPVVNNRVDRLNSTIEKLNIDLLNSVNADFININNLISDVNGDLSLEYTYDGLHFNEKGYEILKQIIEEVLLYV